MSGDPYWAKVELLLHMDGSNESTTFVDSSKNNSTVTANGGVKISTAQSKFGGASGYFDGNGDYLSFSSSSLFNLYSTSFTIEAWIYLQGSGDRHILGYHNTAGGDFWDVYINSSGNVVFRYNSNSGVLTSTATITNDAWTHLAVVCNGSNSYIYLDGVAAGSVASAILAANGSYVLAVGANLYGGAYWNYFNGYIDELRITKNAARYTGNFTPPAAAFDEFSPPLLSAAVRYPVIQAFNPSILNG